MNRKSKNEDNEEEITPDPLAEHAGKQGCAPYLQIFKGGKLVFTTAASKSFHQSDDDLPFCFSFEKSITFPIETVVQGDILIRCRHLTRKGKRVSMFRAAMHTGYVPPKVMRLRKSEIDGACSDKRYADDFFIDLVFEECNASMASKHLLTGPENDISGDETRFNEGAKGDVMNEASVRRMAGTVAGAEGGNAVTVSASAYDSMLHRDSRFWDAITQRRNEKSKVGSSTDSGDEQVSSVFYGPTIGRRREFPDETAARNSKASDGDDSGSYSVASQKSALQSFTIGGEFDFTLDGDAKTPEKEVAPPAEKQKDDLMDALMAIDDGADDDDDDDGDDDLDETDGVVVDSVDARKNSQEEIREKDNDSGTMTEEIVFEDASVSNSNASVGTTSIVEVSKSDAMDKPGDDMSSEQGSKVSSKDDDILNLDGLNLDDIDDAAVPAQGSEDAFDFTDEDDEELADLEEFLTRAAA